MKTDDLIAMLAADTVSVPKRGVSMRLALVAAAALVLAFGLLMAWLGMRPDMAEAMHTSAYWMKTFYTAGLALAGFALVERLSRPGVSNMTGTMLLVVCFGAIVALAVMQLMRTPADEMSAAMMGSTWSRCPWRILALSLPGLIVALAAMRRFAPTSPALAGGGAGIFVGGLAATIYGLYCQETAAPFVAIWYSAGIALSGLLGAVAGSRVLRW
ncbi:MAG: DUF1109 domain-containing protein [Alphaproteobacteria bacterium]